MTPPRGSGETIIATGGSGGNTNSPPQKQRPNQNTVKPEGLDRVAPYNKIYEKSKSPFSRAPNDFLVLVGTLSPGKALDLGMGEGRNTIFLAQRGWDVTGIDLAEVGVAQARKRAQSMGLKVNMIVQDANVFEYGSRQWDLVCIMYFDGSGFAHDFEKRVAAGLKTGGYLIAERPLGSQGNPKMLLDRWTLWESSGFRLIRLEYRSGNADWGHSGLGRYLIQKL